LRLLFVSFGASIHTARWIRQLSDQGWDLHLFPFDPYFLHPDLSDVTVHTLFKRRNGHIRSSVKQIAFPWPLRRGEMRVQSVLKRLPVSWSSDAGRLAKTI